MAIFIYEVIYVLLVEFTIYKWHTDTEGCYGEIVEFLGDLFVAVMTIFQPVPIVFLIFS